MDRNHEISTSCGDDHKDAMRSGRNLRNCNEISEQIKTTNTFEINNVNVVSQLQASFLTQWIKGRMNRNT